MGRYHPMKCDHGVVVDWGDFGPCDGDCPHPEGTCPNFPQCELCDLERLERMRG